MAGFVTAPQIMWKVCVSGNRSRRLLKSSDCIRSSVSLTRQIATGTLSDVIPFPKGFSMLLLACFLLPLCSGAVGLAHPNIIFILMDDLRWDEMDYPFVKVPNIQRIAREGVKFGNTFVTTPLCSPSRASFLTGQYAHKHGVIDNTARDA